jgi:hypothetical protein
VQPARSWSCPADIGLSVCIPPGWVQRGNAAPGCGLWSAVGSSGRSSPAAEGFQSPRWDRMKMKESVFVGVAGMSVLGYGGVFLGIHEVAIRGVHHAVTLAGRGRRCGAACWRNHDFVTV